MGELRYVEPVLLITAAFSHYDAVPIRARERLTHSWGPIALESPQFEFAETDYYIPTMGGPIRIGFWAFERLVDPSELPQIKLQANDWEAEYTDPAGPEPRPLNLDPAT